jgi:hypothetical protein
LEKSAILQKALELAQKALSVDEIIFRIATDLWQDYFRSPSRKLIPFEEENHGNPPWKNQDDLGSFPSKNEPGTN